MCQTCQTYNEQKTSLGVYARMDRYDPTRTTTLRAAFVSEFTKRFRNIRGLIRRAVVDQDVFGLKNKSESSPTILTQAIPPRNAFNFPRSGDKISAFMGWLQQQVNREMLTTTTMVQYGTPIEAAWTNMYVADSYKRGVQRATYEMRKAGFTIPDIEQRGGMDAIMGTPFHMDRVGVLYTRVFEDLKGITSQMDTQISRVLAQGMIDGDNPALLARKINAAISGQGMGELGITDTLGRFIPAERRAKMLARTEVIRAHHMGMMQEYKNWRVEGVNVIAEFVTAEDDRVCEQCLGLVGTTYTLEQAERLIPVHPNCRCIVVPKPVDGVRRETRTPEQEDDIPIGEVYEQDGVQFKKVTAEALQKEESLLLDSVRKEVNETYYENFTRANFTPSKVNKGFCDVYADIFQKKYGGRIMSTEVIPDGSGTYGHAWIKIGNRYFDAEVYRTGGVKELNQLPFFQRTKAYIKKSITNEMIMEDSEFLGAAISQRIPIPN